MIIAIYDGNYPHEKRESTIILAAIVMDSGLLRQFGTPEEIYKNL